MVRLRDSMIYCPTCGAENFYDAEALQSSGGTPGDCWSCRGALRLPARLRIGRNVVMLNHDTKLYPHHLDAQRLYDFSTPMAEVNRHPTNLALWGLKNLSGDKWVSRMADGTIRDVEPGRSVTLAVGTKIQFGASEGEIRTG
jgi:hypothetical protein